jgi:hypothetical protein
MCCVNQARFPKRIRIGPDFAVGIKRIDAVRFSSHEDYIVSAIPNCQIRYVKGLCVCLVVNGLREQPSKLSGVHV